MENTHCILAVVTVENDPEICPKITPRNEYSVYFVICLFIFFTVDFQNFNKKQKGEIEPQKRRQIIYGLFFGLQIQVTTTSMVTNLIGLYSCGEYSTSQPTMAVDRFRVLLFRLQGRTLDGRPDEGRDGVSSPGVVSQCTRSTSSLQPRDNADDARTLQYTHM